MTQEEELQRLKEENTALRDERRKTFEKQISDVNASVLRIEKKLDDSTKSETKCREHVTLVMNDVSTKITSLHNCVNGPDGKPEEGLLVRCSKLEESEKKRGKMFWAIISGLSAIIASAATYTFSYILEVLRSGKPPIQP